MANFQKIRKSAVRSEFFSKDLIFSLNDKNPRESMLLLANAIISNCFAGKYQFRTDAMFKRYRTHGVLPKSFFRESFLRCTKLMIFMRRIEISLDELLDESIKSSNLQGVAIFERNETKVYYKLSEGVSDGE